MQQSGSGIGGFTGIRYQKGDGFFGRLISGTVLPIIKKMLPFLGKTALNTGMDILHDVSQGEKIGDSVKKRVRNTAGYLGEKAMAKVREFTGSGSRRRRRKKRTTAVRKCKKTKLRKQRVVSKKKRTKSRRKKSRKAVDFL